MQLQDKLQQMLVPLGAQPDCNINLKGIVLNKIIQKQKNKALCDYKVELRTGWEAEQGPRMIKPCLLNSKHHKK